jgi:hypothetical protein
VPRHQDYLRYGLFFGEAPEDCEAVCPTQHNITEDERPFIGLKQFEGALGCLRFLNSPAVCAQDFAHKVAYSRFVINYQSFHDYRHVEEYIMLFVAL